MNVQGKLRKALFEFFNNGNADLLMSLLKEEPSVVSPIQGDYPDVHRVVDINVANKNYRVVRKISANEYLSLVPIVQFEPESGVPIWLEGEKLKHWAELEIEEPSDGQTNWEDFR